MLNENKTYLNGMDFIEIGKEHFLIDKFSGYRDIEVETKSTRFCSYLLIYSFEAYFSGRTLTLKRIEEIPMFLENEYDESKFFKFKLKKDNPAFSFIIKGNCYERFKESGFSTGSKNSITSDYVKWIAKQTGTEEVLENLRKEVGIVFDIIDAHNKKIGK